MTTLLIATRNAHKVGEIRAILGGQFHYLTLNDYPSAPSVVEDASTFAGNATKKATELARWIGDAIPRPAFVLADDSGLEVDALGGAPGVHSARFAALDSGHAGNSPDSDNNLKLLRLLQNVSVEKRTARFRCVIALTAADTKSGKPDARIFDGACEGRIDFAPCGSDGFGYDPLFIPSGFTQSFAELGEATKNQLSHRAKALAKLQDYLTNSPSF